MERMIPKGLEPEAVYEIFEEISRIPRASRHEEQISNWLVSFAERYHLDSVQDEMGNVLIRKPGTPGKEDHPAVILQSHMDMVCEKIPESDHDFMKDPIRITVEGDKITAKETTLGADNGLGLSLSLAILTLEDAPHPPLEVLVTVDEELGLTGAEKFDATQLKGEYFINTDSGTEGVFTVGSAGDQPSVRRFRLRGPRRRKVRCRIACALTDFWADIPVEIFTAFGEMPTNFCSDYWMPWSEKVILRWRTFAEEWRGMPSRGKRKPF